MLKSGPLRNSDSPLSYLSLDDLDRRKTNGWGIFCFFSHFLPPSMAILPTSSASRFFARSLGG